MGKTTIYICETKGADQLAVTAKLISAFVFATRIVQSLVFLNPKFQASSLLLCQCQNTMASTVDKMHSYEFSHHIKKLKDKDKEALFNVALLTDNISS